MAIDNDTVRRVAFLSRLKIEDDKLEAAQQEFNGILHWVEELNEVDTTDTEPLISVNDGVLNLRKDDVTDGGFCDDVMKNAPMKEYDYFVVPKVVE